jgi:hypothetical protein
MPGAGPALSRRYRQTSEDKGSRSVWPTWEIIPFTYPVRNAKLCTELQWGQRHLRFFDQRLTSVRASASSLYSNSSLVEGQTNVSVTRERMPTNAREAAPFLGRLPDEAALANATALKCLDSQTGVRQ